MFPFSDRSGPDHTFCYVLYANTSHHSRVRLGLKILFCFVLLFYPDQPTTTTPQIFHHAHLINTYTNTPPLSTLTDIIHGYSRPW